MLAMWSTVSYKWSKYGKILLNLRCRGTAGIDLFRAKYVTLHPSEGIAAQIIVDWLLGVAISLIRPKKWQCLYRTNHTEPKSKIWIGESSINFHLNCYASFKRSQKHWLSRKTATWILLENSCSPVGLCTGLYNRERSTSSCRRVDLIFL